MIEKCENEKAVVHEVDRAELAQVDGGYTPGCDLLGLHTPGTSGAF
jgi:hypothetical protein